MENQVTPQQIYVQYSIYKYIVKPKSGTTKAKEQSFQRLIRNSISFLESTKKHKVKDSRISISLDYGTKDDNLDLIVKISNLTLPKYMINIISKQDTEYSNNRLRDIEQMIDGVLDLADSATGYVLEVQSTDRKGFRCTIGDDYVSFENEERFEYISESSTDMTILEIPLQNDISESQIKYWIERHTRWANIAVHYSEINSQSGNDKVLEPIKEGDPIGLGLEPYQYSNKFMLQGEVVENNSQQIIIHDRHTNWKHDILSLMVSKSGQDSKKFTGTILINSEDGKKVMKCEVDNPSGFIRD